MISRPRVALIEKRTEQQKLMFAKNKLSLARLNMTEPATVLQAIQELHEANEYLSSVAGHDAEKSLVHAMYRVAQCMAIDNHIELADEDKITPANLLAVVDAQLTEVEKAQVQVVKATEYDRFMTDVTSEVPASGIWAGLIYKLHYLAVEASGDLLTSFSQALAAANGNVQALRQLETAMEAAQATIVEEHQQQFARIKMQRVSALLSPYENYIEELNKLLEGNDAVAAAEAATALKKAYPLYIDTNLELIELADKAGVSSPKFKIARITMLHQYILLLQREEGNQALIEPLLTKLKSLLPPGDSLSARLKGNDLRALYAIAVASYHSAGRETTSTTKAISVATASADRFMQLVEQVQINGVSKEWQAAVHHVQILKSQLDQYAPAELQIAKCLRAYKIAKANNNAADLLVAAKKLLSLCEVMSAEASFALTQMTLANIYSDMAAATLAQAPSDLLASQQAIAFYQKAINSGAVDIAVYDALLRSLETEVQLHPRDHLTNAHREKLAYYQVKRQQLLPAEVPVAASNLSASTTADAVLDMTRPASPVSNAKDILIAMSVDALFAALENGGEGVSATSAYHYFKRTHGLDVEMQQRLLSLVIGKLNGENVDFANTEVLLDIAHGMKVKCYVVPAPHKSNSTNIYLALLKTVVERGNREQASLAAQFLAQHYARRYKMDTAKRYYHQSAELDRLHAHVELADIYVEQRRYEDATKELNEIIQHVNATPSEIDGANKSLKIVNYLIAMNAAEKNNQNDASIERLPARPVIYFDLDNTIFLSVGPTSDFYADRNNVPHASSQGADLNKFFNGGIEMWRSLFAELTRQGFDIGICTARQESSVNDCPLYRNFVAQFPELTNQKRHIIFTNLQDKHPFLSDACRRNNFKFPQRQYCILVDDNLQHLREAAAVGMTVINVNRLTKELSKEIYEAFRMHVISTATVIAREFRAWAQSCRQAPVPRVEPVPVAPVVANNARQSAASAFETAMGDISQRRALSSSSAFYQPAYRTTNGSSQWGRSAAVPAVVVQRPPQRPNYQDQPVHDPRPPRRPMPQQGDANADTTTADNSFKRSRY